MPHNIAQAEDLMLKFTLNSVPRNIAPMPWRMPTAG